MTDSRITWPEKNVKYNKTKSQGGRRKNPSLLREKADKKKK